MWATIQGLVLLALMAGVLTFAIIGGTVLATLVVGVGLIVAGVALLWFLIREAYKAVVHEPTKPWDDR